MKLRKNANTDHEAPDDWYNAYGAYVSTAAAGDVCIHDIDPALLDVYMEDQDLIAAHPNLPGRLTDAECMELVAKARSVWDEATNISYLRTRAVDAYRRGDQQAVEDWLDEAAREERAHGDDIATRDLRSQLLVDGD